MRHQESYIIAGDIYACITISKLNNFKSSNTIVRSTPR